MLKKKLILGIGITGMSCIEFFNEKNIPYKIFDTRNKNHFDNYNFKNINNKNLFFEKYDDNILRDVDEVIISPGLDKKHKIFSEINRLEIKIITDIDIFKRYYKGKIISVTGTNGKTTVVSMLEHALLEIGYKPIACGNNGVPPLSIINESYDYIILELSSYQLEYMSDLQSYISIITNIDYDHMERHNSIANYVMIKSRIYNDSRFKLAADSTIYLLDNIHDLKSYGLSSSGEVIIRNNTVKSITYDGFNIFYKKMKLKNKGKHNLNNILCVISVLDIIKVDIDSVFRSLDNYSYLPHRIELIDTPDKINWYNDSKSTNCASTKAALEYLNENIILILGGSRKDMQYGSLSSLINNKVKLLVFIGENKEYIKAQLKTNIKMIDAESIESAVKISQSHSKENDNILLSPASPSFDMFENYEKRGAAFVSAVQDVVK